MKKIGIFVGVEHFRHKPEELKREGLIRLTSVLIHALKENKNVEPVIICSEISRKVLQETFKDFNSELPKFLTANKIPPIFRVINYLSNQKVVRKKSGFQKIKSYLYNIGTKIVIKLASSLSWLIITTLSLFLILLVLLVKFPLYILSSIILLTSLVIVKYGIRFNFKLCMRLYNVIKSKLLSKIANKNLLFKLYDNIRNNHVLELVEVINKSDIDFIFVPVAFYPQVSMITKPKVVTVPDLIVCDYPQYFINQSINWDMVIRRMKELIKSNKYFISYSNYVANKHIYPFASSNAFVKVIAHGNLTLRHEIYNEHPEGIKEYALAILNDCIKKSLNLNIKFFNFYGVKYLVYTSQNRPHKNITNLLQAYNVLLRKKFCNIKLVLTGSFEHTPSVADYIRVHNLHYDVLSLPNLSNKELAALDHLAHLSVNPTLFEGGFPFTFNEAYSVGTPSVMSQIPVVDEVVTDLALREKMLFDPYNVDDMVEKLYWAINNRDELFALQKPLYEKLAARSWEVVANEYIEYFKEIMITENSIVKKG